MGRIWTISEVSLLVPLISHAKFMYDFYVIDAMSMIGDFENNPYPWSVLKKVSGVTIKNGAYLPPGNRERILYFFKNQGVKEVLFK